MRGKVLARLERDVRVGITPAHAGKSVSSCLIECVHQDYPRTCGEKSHFGKTVVLFMGLPPHMRGKEVCML